MITRRNTLLGLAASFFATPAYSSETISHSDMDALIRTLWGEARGEGDVGIIAVGHLIFNRVLSDDPRFKNHKTIKDICHQKMQFSCWTDELYKIRKLSPKDDEYKRIKQLAIESYRTWCQGHDLTKNALFYYKKGTKPPYWISTMRHTRTINHHSYFRPVA